MTVRLAANAASILLLSLSCAIAAAPEADAFRISVGLSQVDAEKQIRMFQAAVATGACSAVADFVRYPLRINSLAGKTRFLWNKTAFCRYFPLILDEKRRQIIANQRIESMPAGWRGLMFGEGSFWMQSDCREAPSGSCTQRMLYLHAVNMPKEG